MSPDTPVTVEIALIIVGGGVVVLLGLISWIYTQFLRPPTNRLDERQEKLDDRLRQAELVVAALQTSESHRDAQLSRGLVALAALGDKLKLDMMRGDMESRIDSAEALVAARQVAVTLAQIQGPDALARAKAAEEEALADLNGLRIERQRILATGDN